MKPTAGTRRNNSKKYSKNRKKKTRRTTSAIWRIFAELNKPKRHYRRRTEHRWIDEGKHVLKHNSSISGVHIAPKGGNKAPLISKGETIWGELTHWH